MGAITSGMTVKAQQSMAVQITTLFGIKATESRFLVTTAMIQLKALVETSLHSTEEQAMIQLSTAVTIR
jgi:hypothetical protein